MAIRVIVTTKKRSLDPSVVAAFRSSFEHETTDTSMTAAMYLTRPDTELDFTTVPGTGDKIVFVALAEVQVFDLNLVKACYAQLVATELNIEDIVINAYDMKRGRIVVNKAIIDATAVKEVAGITFLTFELDKK